MLAISGEKGNEEEGEQREKGREDPKRKSGSHISPTTRITADYRPSRVRKT